jgi:hypothetical protein
MEGLFGVSRAKEYENNPETVNEKNLRTDEDERFADSVLCNAGTQLDEGRGQVASCRFGLQPSGNLVDRERHLKQGQLLSCETW